MSQAVKEKKSLFLGTFNSEVFWDSGECTKLPSLPDKKADEIVYAMDELQFVFCDNENDLVLTRTPMCPDHVDYLKEIGFRFSNNLDPVLPEASDFFDTKSKSICELLLKSPRKDYFKKKLSGYDEFSPYSVLPLSKELSDSYEIPGAIPGIEAVRKVNSKIYSHELSKEKFNQNEGFVVTTTDELERIGSKSLNGNGFLIKEEFGVSGKGNMHIDSRKKLDSIVKYIRKQEKNDRKVRFLIEPHYNKETDFSCQFQIGLDGKLDILSYQKMSNNGFAFGGIESLDDGLRRKLEDAGYTDDIREIGEELFQEGYHGSVCVDSMILECGNIVRIIEINARKSMGLVNHYADRFLSRYGVRGKLMFMSLGMRRKVDFSEILEKMKVENILFEESRPYGFLLLSANTFHIHKSSWVPGKAYKGRLYFTFVSVNEEMKSSFFKKLNRIFAELDIKNYSSSC